ncbi:MAG: hypothetical protein FJY88_14000 [Candidatus Eisenbacteria bacterium]|nr:hypothetical protein [Candidatus Eisenbacteria bacterium]
MNCHARLLVLSISVGLSIGPGTGSGAAAASGTEDSGTPVAGAILFRTALEDLTSPAVQNLTGIPDDLRRRIGSFAERASIFRSRLPAGDGRQGPEASLLAKRRRLERDLFCLVDAAGIEILAADYASRAVLSYEWEGFSDGPMAEAAFAEQFLREHPATPIRGYLSLFIVHRVRCAMETRRGDPGDQAERETVQSMYRLFLEAAFRDPDPLIRMTASDLEGRPYLYIEDGGSERDGVPSASISRDGTRGDAADLGLLGPSLSLRQALDIAEKEAEKRGAALSGQYINSIALRYDEDRKERYWHVQWMWAQPKLGMEYGLRIYMDGEIIQATLGP